MVKDFLRTPHWTRDKTDFPLPMRQGEVTLCLACPSSPGETVRRTRGVLVVRATHPFDRWCGTGADKGGGQGGGPLPPFGEVALTSVIPGGKAIEPAGRLALGTAEPGNRQANHSSHMGHDRHLEDRGLYAQCPARGTSRLPAGRRFRAEPIRSDSTIAAIFVAVRSGRDGLDPDDVGEDIQDRHDNYLETHSGHTPPQRTRNPPPGRAPPSLIGLLGKQHNTPVRLRCRGATGRGRSKNAILGQLRTCNCCRSGPKLRGGRCGVSLTRDWGTQRALCSRHGRFVVSGVVCIVRRPHVSDPGCPNHKTPHLQLVAQMRSRRAQGHSKGCLVVKLSQSAVPTRQQNRFVVVAINQRRLGVDRNTDHDPKPPQVAAYCLVSQIQVNFPRNNDHLAGITASSVRVCDCDSRLPSPLSGAGRQAAV